jgi:fatty-acyl-CoA synthase
VIDGVRFSIPGDRADLLEDGRIQLLGRDGVTINTGGEKVFAEEVEQVLVDHPGVAEAVVVGVPDDRWGSRVTALVVPAPGAELDLDALADHVGSRLAGYKRPRALRLVERIPRTVSGKLDRRWAQDRAQEPAASPQN